MTFRRSIAVCLATLVIGSLISAFLRIGAAGETGGDNAEASVAESHRETSLPVVDPDSGQRDQAQLDQWHKNIAEWKEWEPKEPADNSFCYVCHANYETEKLVKIHTAEGVGCETCHGMSDKHSEDEDSLVPPDVIFSRAKVDAFCTKCHDKDELIESEDDHRKFFARDTEPQDPQVDPKDKTCTNCHAMKHSLANRTRRWNKETREIQWYDGVRMMQQRDAK